MSTPSSTLVKSTDTSRGTPGTADGGGCLGRRGHPHEVPASQPRQAGRRQDRVRELSVIGQTDVDAAAFRSCDALKVRL